jgi:hypothetical protein
MGGLARTGDTIAFTEKLFGNIDAVAVCPLLIAHLLSDGNTREITARTHFEPHLLVNFNFKTLYNIQY